MRGQEMAQIAEDLFYNIIRDAFTHPLFFRQAG
ncbi:Uncharacterised protein [Enterobacter cloacae]|uniref:Uncharacterized protein n=1 Tax=Enterobacter cloacae TaxID=550 RepID=A0A377LRS1_ENTCL|nr:Uncharacterised protein [Enterobacter cloacae]